ncbi:ABC transporter permease [Ketogulonicigenium vulgare]|uniref:ABC transporter permease protein n=1 Tax=Ketogulonicigenium vulgare (strain WSH-001) TaxID=759362 RepID=F9Y615_KETVW|nr:ABC transporter permease [Ketogulonicigenium vulgare]AEM40840.1 ABC transporter permease protein [Ketogulonicigenium vulgare WSH-001]ALJ81003.1 peptide ABC transporter permease [Ketogulonicigenium vulgare]ANW33769.1 peptide ABC transporter permease [Ketogulonicigenium vulgare]AOZ54558.1 ABC transporter permease protein [Ketogulonicigenium vulgare]
MAGFLSVFRGNLTLTIGTIMLLLIVLMAIFAPFLGTVDPSLIRAEMRGANPSAEHWLGGDMLGRDIYSRAIYGARVSLIVGFGVAFLSTVVGVALGLIAGFVRWADPLIMRVMDGLMAIPTILIAIAMIAVAGVSLTNVIISITLAEVPRLVRLVRASVLSLREQPYVEVAAASGASKTRIIFKHLLPNATAPIIVTVTYQIALAILFEAGLSFLGVGIPPTTPTWGNMMSEGRALWLVKPHLVMIPAVFLSVTILAINLIGDGLRDTFDPRMKKRA